MLSRASSIQPLCLMRNPCMRRWEFFLEAYNLNRAFFAFVLDAGLYSIFQAVLLNNAPPVYRFTPFFGLAAWLVRQETVSEK